MDNREDKITQAMTNAVNDAIMDVLISFAPDEKTKDMIIDFMEIMVRNGIPIHVGLKVLSDFTEKFGDK